MGLLQVGVGALSTVLADQWREYFYCDSMDADVLMIKGQKRQGKRNYNTKGSDNIITNGSIIAVNEGQCMIIVEQGAIAEVCAEAGEFVYDTSTEPTIFYGGLGQGIKKSFDIWKRRFTFGGDTAKDQRVYFFNTKEIIGNKYGTASPVPFRVVDANIGLDVDIAIKCFGEYAYRMTDPILFYKNVAANVTDRYTRDQIDSQLKSELLTALQPAFAKISDMGIRYSALPAHTTELAAALNDVLSEQWGGKYGIEISTFGVSSVKAPEEDEKMIKELQRNAAFRNPTMAAAQMVGATSTAMQNAASNTSAGPMMAFAGMNMAQMTGGMNTQGLFAMGQQQPGAPQPPTPPAGPAAPAAGAVKMEPAAGWTCECGATGNTGKFCAECGKPKPAAKNTWTCSCGAENKGKFCSECGKPKPAGVPQYKCDKCGWEPEDPTKPPKFCPECGDPFDDGDIVNK